MGAEARDFFLTHGALIVALIALVQPWARSLLALGSRSSAASSARAATRRSRGQPTASSKVSAMRKSR